MKIQMIAHNFAPENVSGPVLLTEFATDMVKLGHQVTVITPVPNYPLGRIFPGYKNLAYQEEYIDGVRVVRTWSYISPHKTFWRRIVNYITFVISAFFGALRAGKPEILIAVSPPLPLGVPGWLLSKLWRVPLLLQIQDIYPDAAVAMGVLRNKTVIAIFKKLELFLYRQATHISLLTEGFRQNLLAKNVPSEKITVIPIWADPDIVHPMPKENPFREKNGLVGKFVVMYAGNLGFTSCMEDILGGAELLQNQEDIRFVIIGEGVKKGELETSAKNKGLTNVIFLPFQPREAFAEMLAAADVNLVTLNNGSSRTSMPSKTFNIMASARSILVVAPPDSEVAALILDAQCGINVPPEQPATFADAVLKMKAMPERLLQMGKNGRAQLENKFSRAHCMHEHESMLLGMYKHTFR